MVLTPPIALHILYKVEKYVAFRHCPGVPNRANLRRIGHGGNDVCRHRYRIGRPRISSTRPRLDTLFLGGDSTRRLSRVDSLTTAFVSLL